MSHVVVVVCGSPEQAAEATALLAQQCNAASVDEGGVPGLGALATAHEKVAMGHVAMATVQVPVENLHEQTSFADATRADTSGPQHSVLEAQVESLRDKYKALYRYCQSIEAELLDMFYSFLPSNLPQFTPLNNVVLANESGGVIEDYRLIDSIGKGNYGQVYATAQPDGTVKAVKRMPKSKVMSRSMLSRVCAELTLLHGIDDSQRHPNILYFDRVMQSRSYLYFVMPKVGRDIFEFITACAGERAGMDEGTALSVTMPVLSALRHIHAHGYAHRDVKSENILVDFTVDPGYSAPVVEDVRLIDFDMCCNVNDAQRHEGHGSLGFMAPEAMIKNVEDPRKLDVWSSGCVFLEIRMGRYWFTDYWLQPYRDNRHLRSSRTRDQEMISEFTRTLAARRDEVFTSCSTLAARAIVKDALRINAEVRSNASDLIDAMNECATATSSSKLQRNGPAVQAHAAAEEQERALPLIHPHGGGAWPSPASEPRASIDTSERRDRDIAASPSPLSSTPSGNRDSPHPFVPSEPAPRGYPSPAAPGRRLRTSAFHESPVQSGDRESDSGRSMK